MYSVTAYYKGEVVDKTYVLTKIGARRQMMETSMYLIKMEIDFDNIEIQKVN